MEFAGQTALVTGASSGIGSVFAEQFAARGADVVLVARRADRLEVLARRLHREFGIAATAVAADLVEPGSVNKLAGRLDDLGLRVDVLVNNAGFATHGRFIGEDSSRVVDEVALNVTAVVELTHTFLPAMVERGHGVVINVSSTAAFQPVPYMAVYGATKAFVLSFTEALWAEVEGTGVRVLALCPGATDTEFFDIAGEGASVGKRQTPQQVVGTAMRELGRRSPRPSVVTGFGNSVSARLPRIVPRTTTVKVTRRLMSSGVRQTAAPRS